MKKPKSSVKKGVSGIPSKIFRGKKNSTGSNPPRTLTKEISLIDRNTTDDINYPDNKQAQAP